MQLSSVEKQNEQHCSGDTANNKKKIIREHLDNLFFVAHKTVMKFEWRALKLWEEMDAVLLLLKSTCADCVLLRLTKRKQAILF